MSYFSYFPRSYYYDDYDDYDPYEPYYYQNDGYFSDFVHVERVREGESSESSLELERQSGDEQHKTIAAQ